MIEDWIVVTTGVVAIVIALCLSYIYSEGREISLIRNRQKLKVYEDLFHAITDLNVAGDDPYARDRAKMRLAHTLNRLNLVAGPTVLKHVNELLDFLNEYADDDLDVLKQLNILNNIVRAVRRELDPRAAQKLEDAQFRFRFYSPPRG
jgi:hypothetical protein